MFRSPARLAAVIVVMTAAAVSAQPSSPAIRLLDVPYIQQSEALCGGAAAAMVMRYWGATGVYAESFENLVDKSAGGIRGDVLLEDLARRGWNVRSFRGDESVVQARLTDSQPVVALIEDRPGAYHFVVIVAWVNERVVYHDPARAPFRVVHERAFLDAWAKAGDWTMLMLPADGAATSVRPAESSAATPSAATPSLATTSSATPCDALVAEGMRAVTAGDKAGALETFASAADLCRRSSAPLREAAGVYALDNKWTDAARLARSAVERDPGDQHAWRILATSAYVAGDSAAALQAWNRVGEPTIDLVSVQGLGRARHASATSLLDLQPGTTLTSSALASAERRLESLPSAEAARVNYRPLGGGRASVEAVVVERPRLPSTRSALITAGLSLVTDREVSFSAVNVTGGGDRLTAAWRWWEARPRLSLTYAAPSRLGVWRTELFTEEQTYGTESASIVESRRGGGINLANWTAGLLGWSLGAGLDKWGERGQTATFTATVDQRLADDAISLRGSGSALLGSFGAWTAGAGAAWRSRARHEGTGILVAGGMDFTSDAAPLALWPGAGTGHGRGPLLRAHPLLQDGRIGGDVFGRRLIHASLEGRRWMRPVLKIVRIAPAVFVDAARADRRRQLGESWHVDAGAGLRIAFPGSGVLRLDVAKGLRDGSTAFSIGWIR
ncbi:MAG: C39 family peptidase [Acidobacteriota bacterium]|nr:C39 family peptidase [Acidobacteriota bacterium]